jgi:hypothetical protein
MHVPLWAAAARSKGMMRSPNLWRSCGTFRDKGASLAHDVNDKATDEGSSVVFHVDPDSG